MTRVPTSWTQDPASQRNSGIPLLWGTLEPQGGLFIHIETVTSLFFLSSGFFVIHNLQLIFEQKSRRRGPVGDKIGCSAVTKVDTMKDNEESDSEESIFRNNFGKEVTLATTTVDSDTKQPGEHHEQYRAII